MNPIKCPKCGKINDGKFDFCIYCGTIYEEYTPENDYNNINILPFRPSQTKNKEDSSFSPFDSIKYPDNQKANTSKTNDFSVPSRKYRIVVILGYIFSILGGLIGLLIALFLITRKDSYAKQHGWIQLTILVCWILLIAAMVATGQIDYKALLNPLNMSQMNNLTNTTNFSLI